eukprot:1721242-Amphidinium_carterae.1
MFQQTLRAYSFVWSSDGFGQHFSIKHLKPFSDDPHGLVLLLVRKYIATCMKPPPSKKRCDVVQASSSTLSPSSFSPLLVARRRKVFLLYTL